MLSNYLIMTLCLTTKAQSTIINSLHNAPIEAHVMRKTGWDKRIFDLVHWDAHEKAFKQLPRFRQHSTSKLLHNLVNTKQQNRLFYGTSSLCPICQHAEETLQHVFTCNHSSVSALRTLCLDKMFRTLETAQTPQPVLDSLKRGFHTWMEDPTRQGVRAPTAG
jgi:hypothetical protein